MKICPTLKIIVCGLLCVFPVDIKGQTCHCSWNGVKCTCNVGCYLTSGGWCGKCQPNCVSCQRERYCAVCKTGYYGPICDQDCNTCRNGSCTNDTCTDGCADGRYYNESGGYCQPCLIGCVTCNSKYDCKSCIAGHTGSYCQHCIDGYYLDNEQCIRYSTNCLFDKYVCNGGGCEYGCRDGWSGSMCNDACATTCDSCERLNTSTCKSCKPGYYGECLFDCSQLLCSPDGQTSGNQDNVVVIGGAVGSAVVIVLIIVAVLVLIFIKRSRRNEADPERSVTFKNSPIYNDPCKVSVIDSDRITESTAHDTSLTAPQEPVYEELDKNDDVDYGDIKDYEEPTTSNHYNI